MLMTFVPTVRFSLPRTNNFFLAKKTQPQSRLKEVTSKDFTNIKNPQLLLSGLTRGFKRITDFIRFSTRYCISSFLIGSVNLGFQLIYCYRSSIISYFIDYRLVQRYKHSGFNDKFNKISNVAGHLKNGCIG